MNIRNLCLGVSVLILSGCAEMGTAMSQMNQDMGGQCATSTAYYALYHDGEYMEGYVHNFGNDESNRREENWVSRRAQYYADVFQFKMYYDTSPISQRQYRFHVVCSQWY